MTDAQIVATYRQGLSVQAVADIAGVSRDKVRAVLARHKVPPRGRYPSAPDGPPIGETASEKATAADWLRKDEEFVRLVIAEGARLGLARPSC